MIPEITPQNYPEIKQCFKVMSPRSGAMKGIFSHVYNEMVVDGVTIPIDATYSHNTFGKEEKFKEALRFYI